MKTFITFLVLFALCSCYTTQYEPVSKTLDPYLGKSEHEVILRLGPPTRTTDDGAGGHIIDYENSFLFTENVMNTNPYSKTLTTSTTSSVTHYLQFYVHANSTIYNWRTNMQGKPIRVKKSFKIPQPAPPPSPSQIFGHKQDTSKKS